ncbi:hypothetical protein HMPREF9412_2024 [Paenibacillus sp. HGF5]|nr:hypothetical protein HMPREF9412_2024 [Paenibacillus sp. HGF5]
MDHVIPASKGGSDLPHNLIASCSECNTKRGDRYALSYLKENANLVPNLMKLYWRIFKAKYKHRLMKKGHVSKA